jgi:hypothetical protein
MSINPVQGIGPVSEAQLADASLRLGPSRAAAAEGQESPQPNSGTSPNQPVRAAQNASSDSDLPQDEVQVQRDSQADEIVVRYLDHSGNLILQMPSSEVLGLTRAIGEDFQRQAKARAAGPQTVGEGEKNHGH